MYDVIVVGGGASGMMAAGRAAARGKRVLVLEKNKTLGKKLSITGGGRCNITNAEKDVRTLLSHYGDAEPFLYSLFAQFGVPETFSFFESRGLPLMVEARNRAFPKTQKAEDVERVMEQYLKEYGVVVRTGAAVTRVHAEGGRITGVSVGPERFEARDYVIATGSLSHPETGSTGDGFAWVRALGHRVHTPTPTIVPLKVEEAWCKKLSGTTLTNAKITFYTEGKKAFAKKGNILFTHFGISGPLILNSAHLVGDLMQSGAVTAQIDMVPHETLGDIEKRLIAVFDAHKNKVLKNIIKEFAADGMQRGVSILLAQQLDIEKKVHSVTREERKHISRLLKSLPLTIEGLMGFDRAVVADGGVDVSEVDMRTMRSKKIENLYLVGDLLHIRRPSGGYSLQLCWSMGFVAGESVGK